MKPRLRASNMARALGCPGSMQVCAAVRQRPRDDGHEGTYLHWLIASRCISELGATPPEGGLPPPEVPEGYKPPANSLWMVDWAIRHVRETIPADWALIVEVELEHEFDRWIATGHADLVAQSPDGTQIKAIDWKMVYKPVDIAEENDQVLTYVVLLKKAWPDTAAVEFEICSPRLSQEERITSVKIEGAEIEACVSSLDKRACYALDNPDELQTSYKSCQWCVGPACPAIRKELEEMKMKLTPEILATLKDAPNDAELGDFVVTARTLAKPISDATEMLHERLDVQPSVTAGCGIVLTRKIQKGDYSVPDPLKFMSALRTVLPKDEQIAKVMTPSMTRIKDEIAESMNIPKTSKAGVSADSVFDGHLRPLVEQGEKRVLVLQ